MYMINQHNAYEKIHIYQILYNTHHMHSDLKKKSTFYDHNIKEHKHQITFQF